MKITYGKTAYVLDVGGEMMELLESELCSWATGDENFCMSFDEITCVIDEETKEGTNSSMDTRVLAFLKEVIAGIKKDVGDVVFSR